MQRELKVQRRRFRRKQALPMLQLRTPTGPSEQGHVTAEVMARGMSLGEYVD